ncbi:MAG TPA: PhoU domain-containing protein [Usitatibacter sp.]|nr:PhoU domain-containing protein [Usitatibacter sp.]
METADLSHHISRRFNEDLERVRSKVLAMGGFVELQLQKAITALVEGDSSLGEAVAMDDYKVNDMEVSIDEECSRILATRAPAAGDLRLIVAIIKTITDLERIGDHAKNISEYVIYMVHGKDVRHTSLDDVERQLKEGPSAAAQSNPRPLTKPAAG